MKYLFWNTHKNANINFVLSDLIDENGISVVILAEYTADIANLIELLNLKGLSMRQYMTVGCERIIILGAAGITVEPQLQTDKSSIQVLNHDIVLCGVHLNSQIYSDHDEKRKIYIEQVINDILEVEKEMNTRKTVVVGDFNINPYDQSCISAMYFHGLPIYEEAKRNLRTIAGKDFYTFYNPMWNLLGDFNEPYGTYYHNSSDTVNTYWNIYDQVIIRPALRSRFVDANLKILYSTEHISLLDNHRHPDRSISDHLPIMFEIKEDNHEC